MVIYSKSVRRLVLCLETLSDHLHTDLEGIRCRVLQLLPDCSDLFLNSLIFKGILNIYIQPSKIMVVFLSIIRTFNSLFQFPCQLCYLKSEVVDVVDP